MTMTYTQAEAVAAVRDATGICPQCGLNYWRGACGPTHALRAKEIDAILRDIADRIERGTQQWNAAGTVKALTILWPEQRTEG